MGTIVGVIFPVEEEPEKPSKTGKVITSSSKGKKKIEKTAEDKEFEEKEK